jgi:aminoglycoside phosphotransferase (APT) family kinase protein
MVCEGGSDGMGSFGFANTTETDGRNPMNVQLAEYLHRRIGDVDHVVVEGFAPIPGGFSRETFRFDARVTRGGVEEVLPLILRKNPPAAAAILETSRQVEHDLIEALRAHTNVPVSRSYGAETDPTVFGEPAMVIERMRGKSQTSELFNNGPDAHQADEVMRHLCEVLVELHSAPIATLNARGELSDPRGVGIDTSSWDAYMDSTFAYYVSSYPSLNYDPAAMIMLDAALTLRRNKPRPLPLCLVHGDFNPANFLYDEGRVTALIDWENSRVGDPREDLGWMVAMDGMSNTAVMSHPRDEGGFLAYYNKLTGFEITPGELGYFILFGTMNIAVPVASAIKRRVDHEHEQFLHLYLLQPSAATLVAFTQLLAYPGAPA